MAAHVARPAKLGTGPGLLLFQEAYGTNAHMRDVAGRFAAQGYLTILPELFHRTAPGFEGAYGDFEKVRPHVSALTPAGLEADARAAFEWLTAEAGGAPRPIVAVGFCMGGRVSYIANSSLPLTAAVSFYGRRIAPALLDRAPRLHGPHLFFWGGLDKHIPLVQHRAVADALREAGRPFVDVEMSQADHGFFCDAGATYHPASAHEAWVLTQAFLQQALA